MVPRRGLLACLAVLAVAAALGLRAGAASGPTAAPPGTPAVVAGHLDQWPAPNRDYANTRDAAASRISAATIRRLHEVWRYRLPSTGTFGDFSSSPLVAGDRVYLQTN